LGLVVLILHKIVIAVSATGSCIADDDISDTITGTGIHLPRIVGIEARKGDAAASAIAEARLIEVVTRSRRDVLSDA
jgi:hypothetical protein